MSATVWVYWYQDSAAIKTDLSCTTAKVRETSLFLKLPKRRFISCSNYESLCSVWYQRIRAGSVCRSHCTADSYNSFFLGRNELSSCHAHNQASLHSESRRPCRRFICCSNTVSVVDVASPCTLYVGHHEEELSRRYPFVVLSPTLTAQRDVKGLTCIL